MAEPKLLHQGEVVDSADDPRAELKQQQIDVLDRKIRERKAELADMESAGKSIAVRLYNAYLALQAFFEVYDAPASGAPAQQPGTTASAPTADTLRPPDAAAWAAWKARFSEPTARIIDALMIQPLTQTQIATQAHIHQTNVSRYMTPLKTNGLVEQDGSRWRLKRL